MDWLSLNLSFEETCKTIEANMYANRDITIAGRPVRLTTVRTCVKEGWRFYNAMVIRFLDNNEVHTMGAAQFAKWSTKLEHEFKSAGAKRAAR